MNLTHLVGLGALLISTSVISMEIPDPTVALEYMQTGRYSHIVNEPSLSQENPLKVIINTRIPARILNVQEAVEFLLMRSGYQLADFSVLTFEARTLLGHDLPQIHRQIGPMTLDKALQTLAGDAFELVVDPVNRKVAYVIASDLR